MGQRKRVQGCKSSVLVSPLSPGVKMSNEFDNS